MLAFTKILCAYGEIDMEDEEGLPVIFEKLCNVY